MKRINPLICVRSLIYNHKPYIVEAMNGFVEQDTTFPFVCVLIDDASEDGTQDEILNYIDCYFKKDDKEISYTRKTDDYDMIFAQHKNNSNCYFAVYLLRYNHHQIRKSKLPYLSEWTELTKYQAFCEGDDYWINSHKLQIQVDFMESHLDFGLVHTDFDLVEGRRNHPIPKSDVFVFPDILTTPFGIGTATVVIRNSVFNKTPKYYLKERWPMGDLPVWIEISHDSKVKYLNIVTAKYRVLNQSASHFTYIDNSIRFIQAAYHIRDYYVKRYGLHLNVYDSNYYEELVRISSHFNSKTKATEYYNEAKEKGLITPRIRVFYLSACFPFIKWLLSLYIKV